MLRRKQFYVIYPEYFDKELPRNKGRKVPRKIAAENPTIKKIAYACKKLGYKYKMEKNKAYPPKWWEENGRVLISINREDEKNKNDILKELADIIRRLVKKQKPTKKKKKKRETKRTPPVR